MASVRFVKNSSGIKELMNNPQIQAMLDSKARAVQKTANAMLSKEGYTRVNSFEVSDRTFNDGRKAKNVYTRTNHAKYSQNKNKTLTKAFRSAGGA